MSVIIHAFVVKFINSPSYIFFKRLYSSYLLKSPVLAAAPDSIKQYLPISIFYIIFHFTYTPEESYDMQLPGNFTLLINY